MSEPFDISGLENRVAALEKQVAALSAIFAPAPAPRAGPPAPAPSEPAHQPFKLPARPAFNVEAFLGGRLLLAAGIAVFLIGVAFFLKYAFDNGWIGPTGRVTIGLICGLVLIAGSEWLQRKVQAPFAQGMAGLGASVLYLSLWAAGAFFHLLPLTVTFVAMIAVTASVMTIAVRRNARGLALVALAGGLLTPALNGGDPPSVPILLGYLAILNGAVLWLTATRWQAFELLAFAGTQIYLFSECLAPASASTSWGTLQTTNALFATVYLIEFSAAPLLRSRRLDRVHAFDVLLLFGAGAAYYLGMHLLLFDGHRTALSVLCVLAAGTYLAPVRSVPAQMRAALAVAALTFITIFVSVTFHANTITQIYLLEAAALVILGIRMREPLVRTFGYVSWIFALLSIGGDTVSTALFFNARFFTFLVAAVTLGCVSVAARGAELPEREIYLSRATESVAHAMLLLGFAFELQVAYHDSPLPVSLLMLVYALGLMVYGFARSREYARWQGLALFILLLLKVFTIDLSTFDTIVRIVSFLAVGIVLLGVAYLYQRTRVRAKEEAA